MTPAAQTLLDLLLEEREAARCADVGRLERLQEEKRHAVAVLREEESTDEERDQLAQVAHDNIGLMRHLTQILQGVLGNEGRPLYSPYGETVASGSLKHDRGVL